MLYKCLLKKITLEKVDYSSKLKNREKNERIIASLGWALSSKERLYMLCLLTAPRKLVEQKN